MTPDGPVAGGGGGPHDTGMASRLTAVETDVRDIKGASQRIESLLARVHHRLHKVELELAGLKGRIHNLPSTWAMIATVVGGQVALAGMLLSGNRFLTGHS